MKILVFLHGTTIMHNSAIGHKRKEIVKQVIKRDKSVLDYDSYIPIGEAVNKLKSWWKQGAEILYLSSHKTKKDVEKDRFVLKKYGFPEGPVFYRQEGEQYKDVAERIMPDILIEDDCKSLCGKDEMTITHVRPEVKKNIKSIVVKEFGGIDHLPNRIRDLLNFTKYRHFFKVWFSPSLHQDILNALNLLALAWTTLGVYMVVGDKLGRLKIVWVSGIVIVLFVSSVLAISGMIKTFEE